MQYLINTFKLNCLHIALNRNKSHLKVLYHVRKRPSSNPEKTPTIRQPPMNQHLVTGGRKKIPLNRK